MALTHGPFRHFQLRLSRAHGHADRVGNEVLGSHQFRSPRLGGQVKRRKVSREKSMAFYCERPRPSVNAMAERWGEGSGEIMRLKFTTDNRVYRIFPKKVSTIRIAFFKVYKYMVYVNNNIVI